MIFSYECAERLVVHPHRACASNCAIKNGHYLCARSGSIYSRKAVINFLLQGDHLMVNKKTIGDMMK